jgi:bifunctional aspartokinase / homoserine dehydrogenase 1
MSLVVMKFGGTSVGSVSAITALVGRVHDQWTAGDQVMLVVSAMSGVTDMLSEGAQMAARHDRAAYLAIAAYLRERHITTLSHLLSDVEEASELRDRIVQLIDEFELLCQSAHELGDISPQTLDSIAGLGERMSARIIAAALRARGLPAEALDATEFVITNAHHGAAAPLWALTRRRTQARLMPLLAAGVLPVATGYIGATRHGVPTTLGRGGSDYSAAIIATVLDADEVAIYTDVDGVMTADPRRVPGARVIPFLSYAEMGELAAFGAKVLHPHTVGPILTRNIPLRIRNTFNPAHPGTLVVDQAERSGPIIKAVTSMSHMCLITIHLTKSGKARRCIAHIVDMVANDNLNKLILARIVSDQGLSFVVPTAASETVVRLLRKGLAEEPAWSKACQIAVRGGVAIVSAVGLDMRGDSRSFRQICATLAKRCINVLALARDPSTCSIRIVVDEACARMAVQAIHDRLVRQTPDGRLSDRTMDHYMCISVESCKFGSSALSVEQGDTS